MYIGAYSAIHNYCTKIQFKGPNQTTSNQRSTHGEPLIGEGIYYKLSDYLVQYLSSLKKLPSETFLQFYVRSWNRFMLGTDRLNHLFAYLNSYWVRKERDEGHKNIHDVKSLCLIKWKRIIFHPNFGTLVDEILQQIEKQKDGEYINGSDVSSSISSFVLLGKNGSKKTNLIAYSEYLENSLLETTSSYLEKESSLFLSSNSVVDYIRDAETRIVEQHPEISDFETPLKMVLNNILILGHTDILRNQFQTLLDAEEPNNLQQIFRLLNHVPLTLVPLREVFQNHVINEGLKAVTNCKEEMKSSAATPSTPITPVKRPGLIDPVKYIETLLAVNQKFSKVVDDSFDKNAEFLKSLDDGCTEFINNNPIAMPQIENRRNHLISKTPELLVKYADYLLRKKNKESTNTEEVLSNTLTIFKYLSDKNVFEPFYRRLLARRLVNNQSASEDLESEIKLVNGLQSIAGTKYTSKLQQMLNNMLENKDLRNKFRNVNDFDTGISPLILAENRWPFTKPNNKFILPKELKQTFDGFVTYYSNKHPSRKLSWLWQYCRGELKANISGKASTSNYKIFQVSLYQMAILLPYNHGDVYTFQELSRITGLVDKTLSGPLSILVKAKILLANLLPSPVVAYHITTKFKINPDFKSKKEVNLNLPIENEVKKELSYTTKEIEEYGRMCTETCIVRIMKARKELDHVSLVSEILTESISRFKPNNADLKKCIEELIQKDYIKRVGKDRYVYIT